MVVGKKEEATDLIVRLLDKMDGYSCSATYSVQEMMENLRTTSYDVLLIGAGLDQSYENEFKKKALATQPNIKVVEHYVGVSGLLFSGHC